MQGHNLLLQHGGAHLTLHCSGGESPHWCNLVGFEQGKWLAPILGNVGIGRQGILAHPRGRGSHVRPLPERRGRVHAVSLPAPDVRRVPPRPVPQAGPDESSVRDARVIRVIRIVNRYTG